MKEIAYVRATSIYDDSRATKEILALVEAGYKVVVLAWDRTGVGANKCKELFVVKNVEFRFYKKKLPNGIGLKNIPKLLLWFRWVTETLMALEHVDAVHACNLDSGIAAYKFCKKENIPLIYDIYDYYVDSHSIPSLAVSIVEIKEIEIINFAKVTIICTEERTEQISKATPQNVVVIHNSPDIDEAFECSIESDYVYCGAFGRRRLLDEILNGYNYNSDLNFVFAGYGEFSSKVKEMAEDYDNFYFLGQLTYSDVIKIEAKSMALAAIYEPTVRNHRLCAPNKFYEAMALSKPLIVCKGTGIDKIVEDNGLGIVIDYDADQFYSAIRALKSDQNKCFEMGNRARKLYEQKYRWTIMKNRLLEAYRGIL